MIKAAFWTFLLAVASSVSVSNAASATSLDKTQLYTVQTHGCQAIALQGWAHPTRRVLTTAGVGIAKVELCNGGKYPIFTVHFKYDPQGQTDDYFNPLYAKMAEANSFWPFSFVDLDDDVIVDVGVDSKHDLTIDYEDFTPAAAQ
jgi:hypothetical protein